MILETLKITFIISIIYVLVCIGVGYLIAHQLIPWQYLVLLFTVFFVIFFSWKIGSR